jgi:hypothetical protein
MKSGIIPVLTLIALLGAGALISPVSRAGLGSNDQRQQSGSQGAGDDRVRVFRARHNNKGPKVQPAAEMTLSQAQELIQTKSYYAALSPRQPYVEGKGYLSFIFPHVDGEGEINGRSGNARLASFADIVEIGVKPGSPGKTYLSDCTVKGSGPCYDCLFRITATDGQSEQWPMPDSEWKHLLFTVSSDDTDWYALKLQGHREFTLKSCNITEVP